MTQMSASSPCLARVCPRWSSALPIALLSAKLSLHPNVTNRIFICDGQYLKTIIVNLCCQLLSILRLYIVLVGKSDASLTIQNNNLFCESC